MNTNKTFFFSNKRQLQLCKVQDIIELLIMILLSHSQSSSVVVAKYNVDVRLDACSQ